MEEQKKKKRRLILKLKKKYRLVLLNAETLEERFSFKITPMNLFLAIGGLSVFLVFITTFIIAFTPLKEYIPGYGSEAHLRENLKDISYRVDSLQQALYDKDLYLKNIRNILTDNPALYEVQDKMGESKKPENINYTKSKEDSLLRKEMEMLDQYALLYSDESSVPNSIRNYFFFCPLKGMVINGFNPAEEHYGVDIAGAKDMPVKATLDGTVIFTGWTLETGYVITVQHASNLISVYKHNSVLLKRNRDFVKAGEPIAIIGNTGEQTTGPHLHFELWYNGTPVNPTDYITF